MRLFKKHCESECPNFSHKNIGAISLEYILVIVVVALVALTGMRFFGGKVGTTINDSANAVETSTSNVFNQLEGSGSGSGSGTPIVAADFYKNNSNGFLVSKTIYEGWSTDIQAMYSAYYGDVYAYTLMYNELGTVTYYDIALSNGNYTTTTTQYNVGDAVSFGGEDTTVTSCSEKTPDSVAKVQ